MYQCYINVIECLKETSIKDAARKRFEYKEVFDSCLKIPQVNI